MRTVPLKHVADVRVSNVDKKVHDGQQPVRLCNYTDVYYNSRIRADMDFMAATATPEQIRSFGLREGDTIITKDSETAGDIGVPALVTEPLPGVVCGYHLALIRPRRDAADPRFLFWSLASDRARAMEAASATGVTRFGLRASSIGELPITLPTGREQRAIADFLDAETARIDAVLAGKHGLLGRLAEQRLCLAYHLLTGADVSGPRVETGIPWLPTMPQSWEACPIGARYDVQLGRMLNAERRVGVSLRPYLRNANVRWGAIDLSDVAEMDFPAEGRARYRLKPGDLLVCEGGAGIGRAAVWSGDIAECYFQKSLHRLRARSAWPVEWVELWAFVSTRMAAFLVEGNLATIPHLPAERLRVYRVPMPSPGECRTRLARIGEFDRRASEANALLTRQIDLLKERRQALITAAVTGQMAIPGVPA